MPALRVPTRAAAALGRRGRLNAGLPQRWFIGPRWPGQLAGAQELPGLGLGSQVVLGWN